MPNRCINRSIKIACNCPVTLHHQAEGTSAGGRRNMQQQVSHLDPFQKLSLTPFDFEYLPNDGTSSSSGAVTGTVSPASSMHLDDGLVSSCDPASCDFLLFALALHDQSFTAQQHHQIQAQHHQAARILTASMPSSQTGSCNGLCTLTRTCAGVLDAMLSSDCAQTGTCCQLDMASKRRPHQHQEKKQDTSALTDSHSA